MSRTESRSIKTDNSSNRNLQKLAKVFDEGLSALSFFQDAQPSPRSRPITKQHVEQFTPPTNAPSTKTKYTGVPIDLNTAKGLRSIILGYASQSFTNDWKKFFFTFRETKSGIPYGVDASFPGPRAVAICVQAYIMKILMFSSEKMKEDKPYFGKDSPKPSQLEQTNALVESLVEILWKAALPLNKNASKQSATNNSIENRQVIITLVGNEPCFLTKRYFVEDGFTEKMWLFTLYTKQEVKKFIRRNIQYFCSRHYPGAVMLLYSLVLSRTLEVIAKDLGRRHKALLTDNARTTQALINLVLTGNAAPYLHNGVLRYDAKGHPLEHPQPGLRCRSDIGFLFFNKNEREKKRTEVGSMYKTPIVPIWMTQVNGTYGMLFCTSRDLVTDWKTERYFTLHYYNGHFTQKKETLLTIDTRTRVDSINPDRQISIWDDDEEKEKKQPSLENLIFTKWPQAEIDWNGETPFY